MESRISLITLGVSDLSRSKKFYEQLGFHTTWTEDKGVIFFKLAGTALSLYPFNDLVKDIDPKMVSSHPKFSGITLAHNTRTQEEVDEILKRAVLAGGKILKPGQKAFWGGYSGYFSDPDGYVWEIAFGAFEFLPDGSLNIP